MYGLKDYNYNNSTVLLRLDLNMPLDNKQEPLDTTRITASLPTLNYLLKKEAKIVILSHFGRPKANYDPLLWDQSFSLQPISKVLEKILKQPVVFIKDFLDTNAIQIVKSLPQKSIILLENLRFYPGEERNDINFAKRIAVFGDYYVNDAFSCSHRSHASITSLAGLLPPAAGISLKNEVNTLHRVLNKPKRPLTGIIGGAKVSSKLKVLKNLVKKLDFLLIGGAMANTFLKSKGYKLGNSLVEDDLIDEAFNIINNGYCQVFLPIDVVLAKSLSDDTAPQSNINNIPEDMMVVDVGTKTLEKFKNIIDQSHTVLWNGPLGAFEYPPFAKQTISLAQHLDEMTKFYGLITVAGGGETLAALKQAQANNFTFLSTAGGAFLEWLEGEELPGVKVLRKKSMK